MRSGYLIPLAVAASLAFAGCGGSDNEAAPAAPRVPPPALSDLPPPWNEADLTRGKELSAKCINCHPIEWGGPNRVGPNLHGVFDRETATAPKFRYSNVLANWDQPRWTPELVDQWLTQPKKFLPGNAMFFDGIPKEEDRRDLIGWLLIETRK